MKDDLKYESNPKHRDPCQPGQRGSVCPKEIWSLAPKLLAGSELVDRTRYAVHEGKAFAAKQHQPDCWHGYPIGWEEVPNELKYRWKKDGLVSKRQLKKYKESHDE